MMTIYVWFESVQILDQYCKNDQIPNLQFPLGTPPMNQTVDGSEIRRENHHGMYGTLFKNGIFSMSTGAGLLPSRDNWVYP